MPSLCTPEEAAAGRVAIEAAASEVGRGIDPEHFGISLAYAHSRIPQSQLTRIAKRRPGVDPSTLVPVGYDALRDMLQRYIAVGFSKFVLRPADPPTSWPAELDLLADAVLPLQT